MPHYQREINHDEVKNLRFKTVGEPFYQKIITPFIKVIKEKIQI